MSRVLHVVSSLPRSDGRIAMAFARRGSRTVLADRMQVGNARARFPGGRTGGEHDGMPEAVLVNTAGGLTGGDRLQVEVTLGCGAAAVTTTISAEKIYRSLGPDTSIANRFMLSSGASLDWLPQATILFDGSRLARTTEVDMAVDARFLAVEQLIFGRTAMAETMHRGRVRDAWRIRRGGRLVWADGIRLDEPIADALAGPASLTDARAVATVVCIAPEAEDRVEGARAALASAGSDWGISAWNGLLTARLAARDGRSLIAHVVRLIEYLRGRPMPRTWQF
jgi:urease accessory protein